MGSLTLRAFDGSMTTRRHRMEPTMISPGQTLENPVGYVRTRSWRGLRGGA